MPSLRARAKINLVLEVLGPSPQATYHEVATVLHSIDLADTLAVSAAAALHLRCDPPELSGHDNLAWQAAHLLRSEAGLGIGALLELRKGIPVAAGLGGGSADAAGALALLNTFWGLRWSQERLLPLAARLGSDVPFALTGGAALASGRGETLLPLPPLPESWLVLLRPPLSPDWIGERKTARLYALLGPPHYSSGAQALQLAATLQAGGALDPGLLFNAFEAVAEAAYPGLDAYGQALYDLGSPRVHLAGSGPTLFTLAESEAQAHAWAETLRLQGHEAYAVPTSTRSLDPLEG